MLIHIQREGQHVHNEQIWDCIACDLKTLEFGSAFCEVAHSRRDSRSEEKDRNRGGEKKIPDRKSTRLNSSHSQISYAVFCLKKKKDKPFYMTTAVDRSQVLQ